ncbi:MAG: tRNA lysidine(34) synthetase [Eubacteriaceae bacterium]
MKKILSSMRRAIQDFDMIHNGDKIAIGVSGGKDSTILLTALKRYQYFSPEKFEIEAITLDMGFGNMDFTPIKSLCEKIGINYTIKKTQIGPIVFEERKEKNPCALCARMKRGALHDLALELGCKKVALGHHSDDAIETFFLSLFYEGRINTFSPVTYLDRKDIHLIRPLIYTKEKEITYFCNKENYPVVKSTCPIDGFSKREDMKNMIKTFKKTIPRIDDRILSSFKNKEQFNLWFDYFK